MTMKPNVETVQQTSQGLLILSDQQQPCPVLVFFENRPANLTVPDNMIRCP